MQTIHPMRSDTTRHHQTNATQRATPCYLSCIFGSITLHDSSRLKITLHDDALHCTLSAHGYGPASRNQHGFSRSHAAMHDFSVNMLTTTCSCTDELLSTSTWGHSHLLEVCVCVREQRDQLHWDCFGGRRTWNAKVAFFYSNYRK